MIAITRRGVIYYAHHKTCAISSRAGRLWSRLPPTRASDSSIQYFDTRSITEAKLAFAGPRQGYQLNSNCDHRKRLISKRFETDRFESFTLVHPQGCPSEVNRERCENNPWWNDFPGKQCQILEGKCRRLKSMLLDISDVSSVLDYELSEEVMGVHSGQSVLFATRPHKFYWCKWERVTSP